MGSRGAATSWLSWCGLRGGLPRTRSGAHGSYWARLRSASMRPHATPPRGARVSPRPMRGGERRTAMRHRGRPPTPRPSPRFGSIASVDWRRLVQPGVPPMCRWIHRLRKIGGGCYECSTRASGCPTSRRKRPRPLGTSLRTSDFSARRRRSRISRASRLSLMSGSWRLSSRRHADRANHLACSCLRDATISRAVTGLNGLHSLTLRSKTGRSAA
jgi:hypothetical protein